MSIEHKATVYGTNVLSDTITLRVSQELAAQLKHGDNVTLVVTEEKKP